MHLQRLISNPDVDLADIARQISIDPSLTADLLKLVNSAQFMLPKKVDNIVEAVKLVGLRTLKNLFFVLGSRVTKLIPRQNIDREQTQKLPFGLAIVLGTVWAMVVGYAWSPLRFALQ